MRKTGHIVIELTRGVKSDIRSVKLSSAMLLTPELQWRIMTVGSNSYVSNVTVLNTGSRAPPIRAARGRTCGAATVLSPLTSRPCGAAPFCAGRQIPVQAS